MAPESFNPVIAAFAAALVSFTPSGPAPPNAFEPRTVMARAGGFSRSPFVADTLSLAAALEAHGTMFGGASVVSSPRGRYIAWRDGAKVLAAVEPGFEVRQLTSQGDSELITRLVASSDGRTLFYWRGRGDSAAVWRVDVESAAPEQVALGKEVPAGEWIFAPDGRSFVAIDGKAIYEHRFAGGKVDRRELLRPDRQHEAATRIESPVYSPDGSKLAFVSVRKAGHSYIGIYDFSTQGFRYLEPGIFRDAAPAWSPDGARLAFARIPANWSRLYRFAPQKEGVPWSIVVAQVQTGSLTTVWQADRGRGSAAYRPFLIWTPGDRLVFPWEKTGWLALYAIPAAGGPVTRLTQPDGEVGRVVQSPDGASLVYESNTGDPARSHLWRVSLGGGPPVQLTRGNGVEQLVQVTAGGHLAYVANVDGRMPNRVLVETSPGGRPITLRPRPEEESKHRELWSRLAAIEVVPVEAEDGVLSYHLLMKPPGPAPPGGHPVIVSSKGGPGGRVMPGFGYGYYTPLGQYAVAKGYIFLEINYRGCTGFGLDYRLPAERGATGGSEVKDLAALARYLKRRPDVDPKRIGIMGHSYGGHIVGLALSRLPDDYVAGAHMSGVADWVIEMKTDGPGSPPPEFIKLSERMAIENLAVASSPRIETWRAPTLFTIGEVDPQGHIESVIDLGYRLLERGIHAEFYVDPAAGHGLFPGERVMSFFDRYLRSSSRQTGASTKH